MSDKWKDLLIIWSVTLTSTLAVWVAVGMKTIIQNYDGPYYAVVAKTFYDKPAISTQFSFPLPLEYYAAHLPLFPALVFFGGLVTGNLLTSGVIVSVGGSLVGASVLYLIWRNMKWENPLLVSLVWLFAWPRMWAVRSLASPETIFIIFILISLFAFTKGKYLWAGVAGAAATLTKSPGLLLFLVYGLWAIDQWRLTKKLPVNILPVCLIPLAFLALCFFYQLRTGDFWAYFNSGDNIHLQLVPFRVFDSSQPWVGTFWLEDILWIYFISLVGVIKAFNKSRVWGWFGVVFLATIFFVSHRDIGRYGLPLVPVVLLGFCEVLKKREVKFALAIMLVPLFFYTINFLVNNTVPISDFKPFLLSR